MKSTIIKLYEYKQQSIGLIVIKEGIQKVIAINTDEILHAQWITACTVNNYSIQCNMMISIATTTSTGKCYSINSDTFFVFIRRVSSVIGMIILTLLTGGLVPKKKKKKKKRERERERDSIQGNGTTKNRKPKPNQSKTKTAYW